LGGPIEPRQRPSVTPPFGGFAPTFHTEMDPRLVSTAAFSVPKAAFGSKFVIDLIR